MSHRYAVFALGLVAAFVWAGPADAGFFDFLRRDKTEEQKKPSEPVGSSAYQQPDATVTGSLPPEQSASAASQAGTPGRKASVPPTKELVDYPTTQFPGTLVVNTDERALYLVLEGGKALKYSIGVGREGFAWSGTELVTRKKEWPDWRPPAEMRERQPYLPKFYAGGPLNPLGARAIYLGNSLYRIHGTSEDWTIGTAVSSGCIRMLNADIMDLYQRVPVGAKVVVLESQEG